MTISTSVRKCDGFIELAFDENAYILHPEVAMKIAKALAVCLRKSEEISQKIPMVSFGGADVEISDLIEERTIA